MARAARKPSIRSRSIGARYGSLSLIRPGAAGSDTGPASPRTRRARRGSAFPREPTPVPPRAARSRSSVGVTANTSRIVALNCLMLVKPAANAISDSGSVVVSVSTRAVWARCARAMASGPAPSSAVISRRTWRCS